MNKKFIRIIMMSVIIFLLSACGKQSDSENPNDNSFDSIGEKGINQNQLPKGWDMVTDRTLFQKTTESQEYNCETDHQFYLPHQYNAAETAESFYFIQDNRTLFVWDKQTKSYGILCSKPDCSHDINDDACYSHVDYGQGLYYYKNNLYTIIEHNIENQSGMGGEEIVLQKISLDGTEREDICTIAKCYKKDGDLADNTFTVWGVVHRGYLYYVYNFGTGGGVLEDTYYNNNSNILFRIKIDGSGEPECIMPLSLGGNISFMRFQGAGSYLYGTVM